MPWIVLHGHRSATLHVVKGSSGNLLGYDIAQRLGLLKIVNQVGIDKTSPQYLASGEFRDLFGGIGKVRGKVVKLHIDPDVHGKCWQWISLDHSLWVLLVVIDEYSRFPEAEIVKSTSAKSVIPRLDAVFARQGIPDELKTDNGPPFNGVKFCNFAKYLVFHHRKVQSLWPIANGEAEHFMPNLEKCVRTAVVEGKNWKQELYKFLRQYCVTLHTTTNVSSNEALNGRKLKTTLPEVSPAPARQNALQETRKTMAERDAEEK